MFRWRKWCLINKKNEENGVTEARRIAENKAGGRRETFKWIHIILC
jgi:hypothetical protein